MARGATRILALGFSVAVLAAATSVRALPPPEPPHGQSYASPTPEPTGPTLPYGSTLLFVIDQGINSGSTPAGTVVRMHLKTPLIVNGVTLAPAGSPATFTVVSTRKAQSGDVDGAIEVHLDPLTLPDRSLTLPIRAFHAYLTRELTAGQQSTRSATDSTADIFVPYYLLYQVLRKGHQMVLPPGSVLRAETEATIDARNPSKVTLATPAPFTSNYDVPHSDLTPAPFYTPAPLKARPLPKGKPTLPPTPAASASGGAVPSSAASGSPPLSGASSSTPGSAGSPSVAPGAGASPTPSATPAHSVR